MSDPHLPSGDLPPVWVPPSLFPPTEIAKHAFALPDTGRPERVTLLLVGRPDDTGDEPTTLVSFTADDAEALADHLVRMAAVVRRAR